MSWQIRSMQAHSLEPDLQVPSEGQSPSVAQSTGRDHYSTMMAHTASMQRQILRSPSKHETSIVQSSSVLQEVPRSGTLVVVVAAKVVVDSIAEVATVVTVSVSIKSEVSEVSTVELSIVVEATSEVAVLSITTVVAVAAEVMSSVVPAEVVGRHGPALTPATMNAKAPTRILEESIAIDLNECGIETSSTRVNKCGIQ